MTSPDTRKTRGQRDYEADVAKRPTYHDGQPRKRWHELSAIAMESWERAGGRRELH